ncbi:hypothetical protein BUALT_Bualt15G0072500 [Buddleja alternifolia]|uniref:HMA domain-containing protein n=1 Tax=Buddleja alternifolia TaxID=168488 RepID=A0AAV6WBJ2_9LAMI|nr:hypothetical protein BUALT_Bualt15G0072500 [Buddleja alternifolia]
MSMNMKASKKMKGFMCHSQASTAICMAHDYRSVIVPRNQVRLANNTKYIRLGEQRRRTPEFVRRSSFPVSSSLKKDEENHYKPQEAANSLAISDNLFQVVVMRVSIHCQGCAGKVKKHISKMEGVTSFSIDLESKRVTVMGHVSPSGVLESISKVKKAEFWPC